MAIKNEVEVEGLMRAYIRDGVAFVCSSFLVSLYHHSTANVLHKITYAKI